MKKTASSSLLFCFFFILFLFNLPALSAAASSIEGHIKDAISGDPLPGANVMLVGTSLGAASDKNGKYFIPNVPPGSYTLRTTYIGYKRMEVAIVVRVGVTLKQDFNLDYIAVRGEEVVITAQAEGQMEAINKQLSARAIVNVVSSDRIQELPDANAAESVGRLPGVSVLRSGGEGTKVVIRGLSPKYNAVMIEGVRMSSTDFNNRSADLSMISPYMLEGIEVMKAITPDQDADVIGGSVNFKIKEARETLGIKGSRFAYDFIGRGGYNGLKQEYGDYKLVGDISTRLMNGKLGILVQIDIERRNRSSHEMGAGYYLKGPELEQTNTVYTSSLNLSDITRDRKRYGGTFVMDYRLPDGKISFKNLFSYGNTNTQNRHESYNINGNTHGYSATDSRSKLNVMTNVFNFEQNFSRLKIDMKLSHTVSENKAPDNLTFNFSEPTALVNVNPKIDPTLLPDYAKNNLATTYLTTVNEYYKSSRDRELSAAANLEINFRLSNQVSGKVKFGGKYRFKDRFYDHNTRRNIYNLGSAQETRQAILNAFPWMKETIQSSSSNLPYTLFLDHNYNPGTFLNGRYVLGPVVDIDLMNAVQEVVHAAANIEYNLQGYSSVTNDYSGNEYISAGYIMADLNIGSAIKIIPGFRIERMKTKYTAPRGNSAYTGSGTFYRHRDTTMVRTNEFLLPMVHVRYKPFQWFDVRFAYTNTLSRPDFRQIIPRYNISQTAVSWHNYKLQPAHSENFDLYFSLHENHIGLFTLGGFVKRINDLIYSHKAVILDPAEYELGNEVKGLDITTSINNPRRAEVWGIELDWQTHFWYLPGLLRGLVFNANYTHIFSEAKYPRTEVEVEYIFFPKFEIKKNYIYSYYADRMLHQPDNIINAAIGYDYKDFSARISMLFQSDIFKGTNFWPELRRYTDDYLRWDLSVKQDLPWFGLQFYCNINNLTKALDRDLNQGSLFPTAEQYYGRTIDMGLRWRM